MPTFNLKKGDKFSFDKGIKRVLVGAGWDLPDNGDKHDLDLCIFGCMNNNGVSKFFDALNGSHAVFFGNTPLKQKDGSFVTTDGSIWHAGDNRTGAGDGDDESAKINFDKLPTEINEIGLFVTIHEAGKRRQNFSQVKNSYVRVVDEDTGAELCRYDLRNEFADSVSIQVGSFVKNADKWEFSALGVGMPTQEIDAICNALS